MKLRHEDLDAYFKQLYQEFENDKELYMRFS